MDKYKETSQDQQNLALKALNPSYYEMKYTCLKHKGDIERKRRSNTFQMSNFAKALPLSCLCKRLEREENSKNINQKLQDCISKEWGSTQEQK